VRRKRSRGACGLERDESCQAKVRTDIDRESQSL
jgi:hypothetical protein